MSEPITCPKCSLNTPDDWSGCGGICPMPMSPHFNEETALLHEFHWCPQCDDPKGTKPSRILRDERIGQALVVPCPQHGEHLHDSRANDFCWCEK